jgi:oxygen-independent coproporphyrinogen III oxidase
VSGIYIHIPFCKQACHYCNFHFSTNLRLQNEFKDALLKEIALRKQYIQGEEVETIYLGGGTPSLLTGSAVREIFSSLFHHFTISSDPEITLEANPDDIDESRLEDWKKGGINRLSIGVQSFFDEDLKWMNRAHNGEQAFKSIEMVKRAGIKNYSLDLIYGSPGLTDEKWGMNLHKAIALDPTHISCYALTVEPKTALFKMIQSDISENIEPEKQVSQFLYAIQILQKAGFEHYEISSFAQPGKRSRHNSSYWQSKKFLGLGPAAHSFDGNSRQWNIANNIAYINSLKGGQLCFESEILEPRDLLNEYIMTSLRTSEGLDLNHINKRFGRDKRNLLENNATIYVNSEQMRVDNEKLILTEKGKLFADGIAAALFFDR